MNDELKEIFLVELIFFFELFIGVEVLKRLNLYIKMLK